jgi:hypothetical protein
MDDGATTAELRSFNKMSPNRGTEVSTRQQLALGSLWILLWRNRDFGKFLDMMMAV